MENFRSYEEGAGHYLLNLLVHEQDLCFLDFSLEHRLEEALFFSGFFSTQQLCTDCTSSSTTTQSYFLEDEFDALFQADSLSIWADMERGAHHKGEKELKQEVSGDAAAKKRERSEETVFSSTQHICTSTSSAQSCLSQDSILTASEGDHHNGEKNLKQKLDRDAGEKKLERRLSNGPEEKPLLTFELVSQYFCMPVKQAAGELNVGLTHLKRRCRELGIPRWPHRKVKSLETLIKNVQVLGSNTGEEGRMTKIVVEMLQQAKKLIEERPGDVELDQKTKVLRQVCFKENYKRRRLMAIEG